MSGSVPVSRRPPRETARRVGTGSASTCCPILLAQLFHARLEVSGEVGTLGSLRQQPLVNELIEEDGCAAI
jgi:hypothetical protein